MRVPFFLLVDKSILLFFLFGKKRGDEWRKKRGRKKGIGARI